MKLSLTLSLTVALSIASFLRDGLGRSSFHGQVSDSEKKPALPEKQQPVDTQLQASNWPCQLGLSLCPRWLRYRVTGVVIGEVPKQQAKGTEQEAFKGPYWPGLFVYPVRTWKSVSKMVLPQEQQQPVDAEHQASTCTCRLGLFSCLKCVQHWISRAFVTEGPKQQPLETSQKTFKGPWWPGLSVYSIRIWKWVSKMVFPEKQLPVDAKHQVSNWPCQRGLSPCPRWVRYRVSRVVIGEVPKEQAKGTEQEAFKGPYWPGLFVYPVRTWKSVSKMVLPQEQQPVDAEHQASTCTCRLGLFSCLKCVQHRISRAFVTEGPKQQPLETSQKTFKGPWWPGRSVYSIRIWKWVSKMVFPEKQLPVNAEHQASNWPCRLGLSPCPRWVRYRVSRVTVTEGLKQEPLGTEQKSSSLPYPLDQLWDYIAQGALVRLFLEGLLIIIIWCLLRVAHGLWR